jgi:hypothetical protein
MGGSWIISEMIPPTTQLSSKVSAVHDGQIKLAKEQAYAVLNVNGTLNGAPFVVRLKDVLAPSGYCNKESPALFDILVKGVVVGQIQICPGTTYTFTLSGIAQSVKVHVYATRYASNLTTANTTGKWAATAIYSDEIVLKDGLRYNLVSSQDPDKYFKVSLLWKNRDYGVVGTNANADSLREIVVHNLDGVSESKILADQSVTMLVSSPVYSLKFLGIAPVPSCALSSQPTNTNSLPPAVPSTTGTAASAIVKATNATPATTSKTREMSKTASDIANSMADASGDMYAKIMNILGVYVR